MSAIGTFSAVIIALMRDSGERKREGDKDAAMLEALASYVGGVSSIFLQARHAFPELHRGKFVPDPAIAKTQLESIVEIAVLPQALEGINSIDLSELPTARCMHQWAIARSAVQDLQPVLEAALAGKNPDPSHQVRALAAAKEAFKDEALKIGARIRPLTHRIRHLRG